MKEICFSFIQLNFYTQVALIVVGNVSNQIKRKSLFHEQYMLQCIGFYTHRVIVLYAHIKQAIGPGRG